MPRKKHEPSIEQAAKDYYAEMAALVAASREGAARTPLPHFPFPLHPLFTGTKDNDPDRVRAEYSEMPGCFSFGAHPSHAEYILEKIRDSYVLECVMRGIDVGSSPLTHPHAFHFTEEETVEVSAACDLFSRVQAGQFGHLADWVWERDEPFERLHETRDVLSHWASEALALPVGASHGITSPQIRDSARIAYGIHCVLRHHDAWRRHPEGGVGVSFQPPMRWSALADLPVLTPGEQGVILTGGAFHSEVILAARAFVEEIRKSRLEALADVWMNGQMFPNPQARLVLRDRLWQLAERRLPRKEKRASSSPSIR